MNAVPVRLESTHKGQYWAACWRDSSGKRKYRGIGPKSEWSRRAAQQKCTDIAAELALQPGTRDADGRMALSSWCGRYKIIRDDLSDGALELVDQTIGKLKAFFTADPRMDAISPARAKDWALWLKEQPGRKGSKLSSATVSRYLRDAHCIFEAAKSEHVIAVNPFANIARGDGTADEDWQVVTMAQLESILEACPDAGWRCLFALCRLAGTRSGQRGGEALDLTWADVNWADRIINVTDQKTGRKRITPIQPRLYEILREAYEQAPEKQAAVCPINRGNLQRDAAAIIKKAGLEVYAKPLHTLRKNLENEWLNVEPLPTVCKWLGNSPAVAMKHYHKGNWAEAMARVTAPASKDRIKELEAKLAKLREGASA